MSKVKKAAIFLPFLIVITSVFLFSPQSFAEIEKASTLTYAVKMGEQNFLPLVPFCSEKGIEIEWDGVARRVVLKKAGRFVTLMPDIPLANVDGAVRPLEESPLMQFGAVLIPESFTTADWWPWRASEGRASGGYASTDENASLPPVETKPKSQRIIIDPGHGGFDTGAKAYGIMEKDLTLQISRPLAGELARSGFDVVLTRTDDRYLTLEERSKFVAEQAGDLFISIHANSSQSQSAGGFEIYYLSEAIDDNARAVAAYENAAVQSDTVSDFKAPPIDPTVWDIILTEKRRESIMLANMISDGLSESGLARNRGVKSAEFRVLMNTKVPALLLEVGFLTNPEEATRLTTPDYQRELVAMISEAVRQYLKKYEETRGFTV